MTRYFMRDTPLYQMEQMMMTPPNFRPRGHGLHPSRFHYQAKDVECRYCTNHEQDRLCPLCECICLRDRIDAGHESVLQRYSKTVFAAS